MHLWLHSGVHKPRLLILQGVIMKSYAGIGNRYRSSENAMKMYRTGIYMNNHGFTGYSGGAIGSDDDFHKGALACKDPNFTIFKAKDATKEAIELASNYHPAWHNCDDYVQKLHGRNAMIILGKDLKNPRDLVICCATSETTGGTSLGIKIARDHNIPVVNIYNNPLAGRQIKEFVDEINKRY